MEAKNLISFLSSVSKSISQWNSILKFYKFEKDFESILSFIVQKLNDDDLSFLDYLKSIPLNQLTEDELTTYYETLFSEVRNINSDWFCDLLLSNIINEQSEIILENILIFLSSFHTKKYLTKNQKIIQTLASVKEPVFTDLFFLFLLEHSIQDYSIQTLLQHFFDIKFPLKVKLISIMKDIESERQKEFFKVLINRSRSFRDNKEKISLHIFLNSLEIISDVFEDYNDFFTYVSSFTDQYFHENIILEIMKPIWIKHSWISQLLHSYLDKNSNVTKYLIEACGEFIAAFPESLIQKVVNLSASRDKQIRLALTSIITELWINEKLIENLIRDQDDNIKLHAFQAVIPVFTQLTHDLQSTFLEILTISQYEKMFGYLHGFHFDNPDINKNDLLDNFANLSEERKAGICLGLGLKWNMLNNKYRNFLNNFERNNFSSRIKQHLIAGLESYFGILDEEGIKLFNQLKLTDFGQENDIILL